MLLIFGNEHDIQLRKKNEERRRQQVRMICHISHCPSSFGKCYLGKTSNFAGPMDVGIKLFPAMCRLWWPRPPVAGKQILSEAATNRVMGTVDILRYQARARILKWWRRHSSSPSSAPRDRHQIDRQCTKSHVSLGPSRSRTIHETRCQCHHFQQ